MYKPIHALLIVLRLWAIRHKKSTNLSQQKPPKEEWGFTKTEDEKILSDCPIYNNEYIGYTDFDLFWENGQCSGENWCQI